MAGTRARATWSLLAAVAAAIAIAGVAAGDAGSPGFGNGGSLGVGGDVLAIFPQSDGTTVAVSGELIVRLLPDGRLDPRYGRHGRIQGLQVPCSLRCEIPHAAADRVGRILVAQQATLSRRRRDGTLDRSFGRDGRINAAPGRISSVAVDRDGRILLALALYDRSRYIDGDQVSPVLLARYRADGSPDSSFGSAGRLAIPVGGPARIAVQDDGAIVVAGRLVTLARYRPDGSPDPAFAAEAAHIDGLRGDALALARDGTIFVAGLRRGETVVAHVLSSGALDDAFGAGGLSARQFMYGTPRALAALPTGGVAVAGIISRGSAYKGSWALRAVLSPQGEWKEPQGGWACSAVPAEDFYPYEQADSVAVDSEGRLLYGGVSCDGGAVTRYLPTLAVDAGPPLAFGLVPSLRASAGAGVVHVRGTVDADDAARFTVVAARVNAKRPCSNGPPLRLLPGSRIGDVRLDRPGWVLHGEAHDAGRTTFSLTLRLARAASAPFVLHVAAVDPRQRAAEVHQRLVVGAGHGRVPIRAQPLAC